MFTEHISQASSGEVCPVKLYSAVAFLKRETASDVEIVLRTVGWHRRKAARGGMVDAHGDLNTRETTTRGFTSTVLKQEGCANPFQRRVGAIPIRR